MSDDVELRRLRGELVDRFKGASAEHLVTKTPRGCYLGMTANCLVHLAGGAPNAAATMVERGLLEDLDGP